MNETTTNGGGVSSEQEGASSRVIQHLLVVFLFVGVVLNMAWVAALGFGAWRLLNLISVHM